MATKEQASFIVVEGDTLPQISGTLINDDDPNNKIPYDISAAGWIIRLHVAYDIPLVKIATKPTGGADGTFCFPWEDGDLQEGTFEAEVQVTSPLGTATAQRTADNQKFKLVIRKQIA